MKKIFSFLFLAFTLASAPVYSQTIQGSGNHAVDTDSLLFDGSQTSTDYIDSKCGCALKILRMTGYVVGSVCEHKISSVCGVKDTAYVVKKGLIPPNATKVLDGDSISTVNGEGNLIELQFDDGKKLMLMPGSSIRIDKDHCKHPIVLVLHYGSAYLDFTEGDHNKSVVTKTEQGEIINHGTRFSVELTKNGDVETEVVKVYEGSVSFKPNTQNKAFTKGATDKGAQIKQLNADFQAGKITKEEFAQKLKELTSDYKGVEIKEVTVEAGYQSTITGNGNPSDPVTFDVSDDPGPIKE